MTIVVHPYDNTKTGRTDISAFGQRVAFGVEAEWDGLGVGEFRARRIDEFYLLESTQSIDTRRISNHCDDKDTRNYEVLGIMSLSERAEAAELLHKRALSYAGTLNTIIGCGIVDLNKKG